MGALQQLVDHFSLGLMLLLASFANFYSCPVLFGNHAITVVCSVSTHGRTLVRAPTKKVAEKLCESREGCAQRFLRLSKLRTVFCHTAWSWTVLCPLELVFLFSSFPFLYRF